MDNNLLEILIPLLFFAAYFVSQLFGKKSQEEEMGSEQEPADELRKIREELRRKIEERRKGAQPEVDSRSSAPVEPQAESARGGAVLRESQRRRTMSERQTSPSQARETAGAEDAASRSAASRAASTMERDLEAQMEEVRRSKEKADAARREAGARMASVSRAAASGRTRKKSPASYRQFLRESLDDPRSLQKSFILHEVFGTPVGSRREGQMRPSWDL